MRRAPTHSRIFVLSFAVVALPLFALLLWGNGKKWYERRQQEKTMQALQQEIARLKSEERAKQLFLEKLQSPFFIEKEGREKFGAAKLGEKIVVFPESVGEEGSANGDGKNEKKASSPFFQQWFQYFFTVPK